MDRDVGKAQSESSNRGGRGVGIRKHGDEGGLGVGLPPERQSWTTVLVGGQGCFGSGYTVFVRAGEAKADFGIK